MSMNQYLVLVAVEELTETKGRCIIGHIIPTIRMDRVTITKHLNQLCGKDYVARINTVNPYKSNRYQTTLKGRVLLGKTDRLLNG